MTKSHAQRMCRNEVESKMKLADSGDKLSTNCWSELRCGELLKNPEQLVRLKLNV